MIASALLSLLSCESLVVAFLEGAFALHRNLNYGMPFIHYVALLRWAPVNILVVKLWAHIMQINCTIDKLSIVFLVIRWELQSAIFLGKWPVLPMLYAIKIMYQSKSIAILRSLCLASLNACIWLVRRDGLTNGVAITWFYSFYFSWRIRWLLARLCLPMLTIDLNFHVHPRISSLV